MNPHYQRVKNLLLDLDVIIIKESPRDELFVIENESAGIKNMIIGVAEPIVIVEQFICRIATPTVQIYESLLKKNRDIIHGAFVLDDTSRKLIFRDTLQVSNLDSNELEATINSLSLLLSEYSDQLIQFTK